MPIIQGGNTPQSKWQTKVETAISKVIPFKGKSGGSEAIVNKVRSLWKELKSLFEKKPEKAMTEIKASTTPLQDILKQVSVQKQRVEPEMKLPKIPAKTHIEKEVGALNEAPRRFENNREFNSFLRQTEHSEADIKMAIDKNAMKLSETRIPDDETTSPLKTAIEAGNVVAVKYILKDKDMYVVTDTENRLQKVMIAAVRSQNSEILEAVMNKLAESRGHLWAARDEAYEIYKNAPEGPQKATAEKIFRRFH